MKATLEIPDDLYRKVKAKSALEGRPLRSVAIELFQKWLHNEASEASNPTITNPAELAEFPWLAISQKYVKPGMSHSMDDIRESIHRGRAAETLAPYGNESGIP
jgi:hypothetical protein